MLKPSISLKKNLTLPHMCIYTNTHINIWRAPLSKEFSRQEYWSGLPFPSPGDLSDTGNELMSPALQADSLLSEPSGKPIFKNTNSIRERFIQYLKILSTTHKALQYSL